MWQVTEDHLESIAIGAGILGTGGGGNPYIGQLRARQVLRERGPVTVLSPEELTDDARVICVGGIGAPTVGIEKVRDTQSYRCAPGPGGVYGYQRHCPHLKRDRRQQLGGAPDPRRYVGPARGRRRRNGPRLPRASDEDLFCIRCGVLSSGNKR